MTAFELNSSSHKGLLSVCKKIVNAVQLVIVGSRDSE